MSSSGQPAYGNSGKLPRDGLWLCQLQPSSSGRDGAYMLIRSDQTDFVQLRSFMRNQLVSKKCVVIMWWRRRGGGGGEGGEGEEVELTPPVPESCI